MKSVKKYVSIVHSFRNGDHFDFYKFISTHINPLISAVPEAQSAWYIFYNLFQQEDVIFKKSLWSIETKYYISEANIARHNAFSVFRERINTVAGDFDETEKEAAVILTEVLKIYKAIGWASITEVGVLIINMIQDLARPRYAAAVKTLKLESLISRMGEANDKFMNLYEERAKRLEASGATGTMRKIRAQVNKAFKFFTQSLYVVYIEGVLAGKDVTAAGEIIDYINAIIDQFERVMERIGYWMGKKGNDNSNDDSDEPLVPAAPVLSVSEQTVLGEDRMLLVMADQKAFASALYPAATDGKLKLLANDIKDVSEFPIKQFSVESGKAVGLIVGPPRSDLVFRWPMQSNGACSGKVFNANNVLLTVISKLEWPSSIGK
ncbi:MAG: DUF6261 family protein [Tannerellaceae bacterium]|jgi:hypothetical protein|nr:DUF6261 family protein [Tannerellaceae bacterium]